MNARDWWYGGNIAFVIRLIRYDTRIHIIYSTTITITNGFYTALYNNNMTVKTYGKHKPLHGSGNGLISEIVYTCLGTVQCKSLKRFPWHLQYCRDKEFRSNNSTLCRREHKIIITTTTTFKRLPRRRCFITNIINVYYNYVCTLYFMDLSPSNKSSSSPSSRGLSTVALNVVHRHDDYNNINIVLFIYTTAVFSIYTLKIFTHKSYPYFSLVFKISKNTN